MAQVVSAACNLVELNAGPLGVRATTCRASIIGSLKCRSPARARSGGAPLGAPPGLPRYPHHDSATRSRRRVGTQSGRSHSGAGHTSAVPEAHHSPKMARAVWRARARAPLGPAAPAPASSQSAHTSTCVLVCAANIHRRCIFAASLQEQTSESAQAACCDRSSNLHLHGLVLASSSRGVSHQDRCCATHPAICRTPLLVTHQQPQPCRQTPAVSRLPPQTAVANVGATHCSVLSAPVT